MTNASQLFRLQTESESALKLELAGYLEVGPGWQGTRHSHSFWELVYLHKGEGRFLYGNHVFDLECGSVLLIEPNVEHQFTHNRKSDATHLYIGFSVDGSLAVRADGAHIPVLRKATVALFQHELREIVLNIETSRKKTGLSNMTAHIMFTLFKILPFLFTASAAGVGKADDRIDILVGKAKKILLDNLGKNISVRKIAGSLYLSPHYFGDLFKKHTGRTIKEFHNDLRMRQAEIMLRDHALSISEIADALGFKSIHYFTRKFTSFHGASPSAFRTSDPR